MDWSNERYVRAYTRDTADLLAIKWQGRALWWELLRKADRAGVIDGGDDVGLLAELVRMPVDVVEAALARMVDRRMVEVGNGALVIPNYIAANEATQSDKQRSKEYRARRRDQTRAGIKSSRNVTGASRNVTGASRNVTGASRASRLASLRADADADADTQADPDPVLRAAAESGEDPKLNARARVGQAAAAAGRVAAPRRVRTDHPDPESPSEPEALLRRQTPIRSSETEALVRTANELGAEHNRHRVRLGLNKPLRFLALGGLTDAVKQALLQGLTPDEIRGALEVAAYAAEHKRAPGILGGRFWRRRDGERDLDEWLATTREDVDRQVAKKRALNAGRDMRKATVLA